jgi:hypothetical protein
MTKSKKYVVVGFPKCGQVSLVNYLIGKGFDVTRQDCIWRSNARQLIEEQQPDRIPIIVTRDPVDMIWSSYWYWPYNTYMSFPKYLKHEVPMESSLGTENPIDHADYERHIEKFADMNPIILKFEDLVKFPDYPHDNKTVYKPQITQAQRDKITEALDHKENYPPYT